MHDIVILGAGIAGLAAAWELQQHGIRPLILEQSARAGGVIRTDLVDGFVIDGGPDSMLVQKPAAVDLCRELGIADRLVPTLPPRTAFVKRGHELVPLPDASFFGLPTRLWPFVSSRLFSSRGKARMAMETMIPRQRSDDESIGSFMRRRFGTEACALLAEPLLAGIHAGDVDRLSIHALFPRIVEAERVHGSVLRSMLFRRRSAASHSAFVSFPGGIVEIVDRLIARLDGATIRCSTAAVQVTGAGPYAIRLETGEQIESRAVIVATPALAAASALLPLDAALASLCAAIPYVSSATAVFGMRRAQVAHALAGTGYVVPRRERRTIMAATWVSSKWPHRAPEGHVLLRAFLGGAHDPGILGQGDAEIAHAAFGDLANMLDITGEPHLTRVYRWPHATPQYHVGHLARVREIDDRASRLPGLYLTGSGYRGTGIPDCIADARATARSAVEYLQTPAGVAGGTSVLP
jgi:oxygen-dependent protoporphyrinogen oxidase